MMLLFLRDDGEFRPLARLISALGQALELLVLRLPAEMKIS
jgi:hypothetical protein